MHLLVIEDECALCETIVRSLRRLAYSVDYCYDGEKALELLGVLVEVFEHGLCLPGPLAAHGQQRCQQGEEYGVFHIPGRLLSPRKMYINSFIFILLLFR